MACINIDLVMILNTLGCERHMENSKVWRVLKN